ncbi:uncharacterized protein LY89DRAFT_327894 [Mollisia scopiformis]|uniref:Uncharacterized protein n=1 Tax=Mollisia scopiformis TaxID=149040 RepID=A0A132B8Z2_MOLSC|nr:uncharacterized protein LY89DRAFT_327894 [Mollisia scopiformis]KUJ08866.1 hypothetical protein LY89DRAFT_327894 [Mollisia scopiformis]
MKPFLHPLLSYPILITLILSHHPPIPQNPISKSYVNLKYSQQTKPPKKIHRSNPNQKDRGIGSNPPSHPIYTLPNEPTYIPRYIHTYRSMQGTRVPLRLSLARSSGLFNSSGDGGGGAG